MPTPTSYVYTISTDIPSGLVSLARLTREIELSGILTQIDYVAGGLNAPGDNTLTLWFKDPLPSGEKFILDGSSSQTPNSPAASGSILGDHSGVALPDDPQDVNVTGGSVTVSSGSVTVTSGTINANGKILSPNNVDYLGDATNPLRVDVTGTTTQPISAASLPLPTGAATETTLATRLSDSTFTGRINTLGQKTSANSTPVVISSDQSTLPVSAASLPLPTGAATSSNQTTLGSQTTKINDGTNTATIKAASTAAVASDTAIVVAISPNNSITASNPSVSTTGSTPPSQATLAGGSVTTSAPSYTTGQLNSLSLNTSGGLRVDGSGVTQPISASSLPLPTGAATETTLGTRLADSTFTGRINTLGQKTMANSTPVVISSDQSTLPISAASLPLPTGAATSSNQTTLGSQTTKINDGTNTATIKAASTAAVATDTAIVVAISPNNSITASNPSVSNTGSAVPSQATLSGGSVTTSAPSYTTGQLNSLSLNTSGGLRVDGSGVTQPISAASLPLPTGAATETTLASINTKTLAAGQAAMAASYPVVIASNQSTLPVSAASLPLPTGAATEATLATLLTSSTFTGRVNTLGQKTMANSTPVVISSDQSTLPVSAASLPLPTGAATSSNQTTLGSQTTKINDGTNTATIKAASTASVATDTALVVSVSPNNSVAVTDNGGSLTVDTTQLPSSLLGGRLDTNVGSWLGSTAPTVGSKTSANSVPIVVASDQAAVATKMAVGVQVDGHSASIGATTDADTANTVIGRLKQIITKLAGGLPSALIGGRLDTNVGSWLGSTAPTVGQKTMANSVPVAISSDQTGIPVTQAGSTESTYTVMSLSTTLSNNKSLLSIYNPTGSGVTIKFREYYLRNPQTSAVTGVAGNFSLFRFSSVSAPAGGTIITPVTHDTNDPACSAVCKTGATITGEEATPLDRIIQSTDEWGPGTLDQEGAQQNIANYLPARAKRDAQVKAFTINPGQGLHVKFATNSTAGTMDIIVVITQV